jgi:hypothetical protein
MKKLSIKRGVAKSAASSMAKAAQQWPKAVINESSRKRKRR